MQRGEKVRVCIKAKLITFHDISLIYLRYFLGSPCNCEMHVGTRLGSGLCQLEAISTSESFGQAPNFLSIRCWISC
nr:hypothetical transcript [Hymenolepis microstoma]